MQDWDINSCIPVNTADEAMSDSTYFAWYTMLITFSSRTACCQSGWLVGMGCLLVPICCHQHLERIPYCSMEFSGWDVSLLDLCEVLLHKVGVCIRPMLLHVPPTRCYLLEFVKSMKHTDKGQLFKVNDYRIED